jgi:hypothetical protein
MPGGKPSGPFDVLVVEMATEVLYPETEEQRIESWRMEALERAGYGRRAAAILAARKDIDLHTATSLVEHGCSPELALEILL